MTAPGYWQGWSDREPVLLQASAVLERHERRLERRQRLATAGAWAGLLVYNVAALAGVAALVRLVVERLS